jgi:restriction system protein
MEEQLRIPSHKDMLWTTLCAVRDIGDSGTNEEIVARVVAREGFSEAQLEVPSPNGRNGLIEYRLAWARSYLKGMGLLDNSRQGVWSTTERGRSATEAELPELFANYGAQLRAARKKKQEETPESEDSDTDGESRPDTGEWKDELLAALKAMAPDRFERLARRLLREAGFVSVNVTGKSGDGGIDGVGTYRLSLVSFPVFFQCKRYKGSVSPKDVRDFRGAMSGRGDYGLLITTGTFTSDAKTEATRDGAPTIDLIEGDRLCDLLKQYQLGVQTTSRQVEDVEVVPSFFEEL